jgi:predicted secreted protein
VSDPPPPPPPPSFNPPPGATEYGGSRGTPPPNYLVWAILSTIFCCLPLGVASIIFAAQVNTKYTSGDTAGALASSNKAKMFAIYSAVAGVIVGIIYGAIAALD